MASGFFALLDDIAVLTDDVAVMGKVATKKTAGILGDDLAVNAEKASGFVASREIPVLWAITKGSFLNKLIILPLAFLLSAFAPAAIPLILIGGALYLAYEGAEKVYELVVPHQHAKENTVSAKMTKEEVLAIEKNESKIGHRHRFYTFTGNNNYCIGNCNREANCGTNFSGFFCSCGSYRWSIWNCGTYC